MKMSAENIIKILPKNLRKVCRVGIADPAYLEKLKPVFSPLKNRWSAKPSDIYPSVKSIITLIHFTPIALDYSVEEIILLLADLLWKKLKIRTHVLDKFGKPREKNLVGTERIFSKEKFYSKGEGKNKIVFLKDIAYYAGLGQYGKSSLIINSKFGSDIKIQVLFTESEFEHGVPILPKQYPGCKFCNICIDYCPHQAINSYKVDPLISPTFKIRRCMVEEGTIKKEQERIAKLAKLARIPQNRIWCKIPPKINIPSFPSFLKENMKVCRVCQALCPANWRYKRTNSRNK